ncbi:alpha/beta fold hydrolase [Pseudoflavonifractor sp. HCP28S3_F10]|uniref:alpha/beta fold hydrolase n=1 Tax=Pseudoflavonifractor sp. HCP28S3_F10 TaxID=3438947 RepID=UPI003F8C1D49
MVGGQASHELAEGIPGSRLIMYPQYGHAVYEEAKDFNQTVLDFLTRQIRPCSAAEI